MNIVGLIIEYNHFTMDISITYRKQNDLTKADATVVIMSGNFVQRGCSGDHAKTSAGEICALIRR